MQEILRPFANQTWYLMFFVIILSIVVLSMILHLEGINDHVLRMSTSFLINVGALCQQSEYMTMHFVFFLIS